MSGVSRPSRGARVVYKEADSSEDEEEFESEEAFDYAAAGEMYQSVLPPLTPLQLELRQLCRSGNKAMLKTFLVNNPEIDLDVKDPEAGTTALNEAATKTAQFVEIVSLLLQAGADLEVTDGLGNTPLHNAVLYYPSTQHTVDMLLEKGANVSAMNYEGSTPLFMADDKDLKIVLRQLKKAAEKKSPEVDGVGYSGSPDMRKMVFDKKLLEERESQSIIVKYNSPVVVKSPGLLKRKREDDDLEESFGKKRIRFCEQDSTGADIDPQFSDEEDSRDSEEVDKKESEHDIAIAMDKPADTPATVTSDEKSEEKSLTELADRKELNSEHNSTEHLTSSSSISSSVPESVSAASVSSSPATPAPSATASVSSSPVISTPSATASVSSSPGTPAPSATASVSSPATPAPSVTASQPPITSYFLPTSDKCNTARNDSLE